MNKTDHGHRALLWTILAGTFANSANHKDPPEWAILIPLALGIMSACVAMYHVWRG